MAKVPVVNEEVCIGCGLCVSLAPATFKMNDQNKAEVLNSQSDEPEKIQEAIDSCPVTAITQNEA